MKNTPDCPKHIGMPSETESPKSSTDAGIKKQTNLAVLAVLAALATTGCNTKLDEIERLGWDDMAQIREMQRFGDEVSAVYEAEAYTEPTRCVVLADDPDSTAVVRDEDIVRMLNRIFKDRPEGAIQPHATIEEWKQNGLEIETEVLAEELDGACGGACYPTTRMFLDGKLVMRADKSELMPASAEIRTFDDNVLYGVGEVISFNPLAVADEQIRSQKACKGVGMNERLCFIETRLRNGGVQKISVREDHRAYSFNRELDRHCVVEKASGQRSRCPEPRTRTRE